MDSLEKRRHARRRVNMIAAVMPDLKNATTAVIDLSESGARLDWTLHDEVAIGSPIRVRFLLPGDQSIELDARVARLAGGQAGIEFQPAQQALIRQLMAEARSSD